MFMRRINYNLMCLNVLNDVTQAVEHVKRFGQNNILEKEGDIKLMKVGDEPNKSQYTDIVV